MQKFRLDISRTAAYELSRLKSAVERGRMADCTAVKNILCRGANDGLIFLDVCVYQWLAVSTGRLPFRGRRYARRLLRSLSRHVKTASLYVSRPSPLLTYQPASMG